MRLFLSICLLCSLLVWLSPAASAGQIFYDFSGAVNPTTLTAIDSTGVAHTIGTGTGYSNVLSSALDPSSQNPTPFVLDGAAAPVVAEAQNAYLSGTWTEADAANYLLWLPDPISATQRFGVVEVQASDPPPGDP